MRKNRILRKKIQKKELTIQYDTVEALPLFSIAKDLEYIREKIKSTGIGNISGQNISHDYPSVYAELIQRRREVKQMAAAKIEAEKISQNYRAENIHTLVELREFEKSFKRWKNKKLKKADFEKAWYTFQEKI